MSNKNSSDEQTQKPVKTGLVGHPVNHSKSPLIHEYWINKYAVNATYELFDLPCEDLKSGIKNLCDNGCSGFNVTIPHKVAIMDLCDDIDELAKTVGAVNTVTIKGGRLYGTNTDIFGFTQNIKELVPSFDFRGKKALILGAGGAARAVVQGLLQEGIEKITLCNRTEKKADELIKSSSNPKLIQKINWNDRSKESVLENVDILVNTTSLGMSGKPELDIDLGHLNPQALVNDIVYAPLQTKLLTDAKNKGNITVTGIGMLLHQARPAFESWHGILPGVTQELREIITK